MTVSLERTFFAYILRNKNYFENVYPEYFKNPDIEFVYSIIRKYMMEHIGSDVPSPKQIAEMVFLEDKDGKMNASILKTMLKEDLKGYDEETFLKPKLSAWIMINRIQNSAMDVIDETRKLDDVSDLDSVLSVAGKIKDKIDKATVMNFDEDDNLVTDFDDFEEHAQDHSQTKIKTGWNALDNTLSGGWDVNTLNILMAETNGGKCSLDVGIKVRNKNNGSIETIDIKNFLERISK